jgi:DNA adenine methylase
MPRQKSLLRPPLRWAGSKRRLVPTLRLAAPQVFDRYIEPFAGSACLFFALKPRRAVLSDINSELINFYKILRMHPILLARRVSSLPATERYYYDIRQAPSTTLSDFDRAVKFLYLNRFCFNGVYRTNRAGDFNVPRGVHTGNLPSERELLRCSMYLRKAELRITDFEAVTRDVREGDFLYIDPPYAAVNRKSYGEYGYGSFADADQPRLLSALQHADSTGAKVILSFRYDPSLAEQLRGWSYRKVLVRRNVAGFSGSRRLNAEMLLANFPLPERDMEVAL